MHKLLIAAALLTACAGCNTLAGLGKDLQIVGGVMTGTAEGARTGATQPGSGKPPCVPDDKGRLPAGCASGQ
jgi:predicted small secreted protein